MLVLEKNPKNTTDSQENQQMDHRTWSTSDQSQIIIFWTYYVKILLSGEIYNGGEGRGKRKEVNPTAR